MILMRILPAVLKELSKHVPTVLFQTVEWGELASELPKITRRMLQKEGFQKLFDQQTQLLAPYSIVLIDSTHPGSETELTKDDGHKILTLFFVQLFSPYGLFLDLRSSHFSSSNRFLEWHPSGFWTCFDEAFRLGLLEVYEGFYLNKDDLYFNGLEKIGLIKSDWPLEDKQTLAALFRVQFGNNDMTFDLEQFKDSIIKMSDFMLKKKVKISKDFLYLGIYLVTLYSSLEETRECYSVKATYLEVRNKFSEEENR